MIRKLPLFRSLRHPVRYVFPGVCVFVFLATFVLVVFSHPSGQNDENFLSHLPVEKSGVRPLCDSKDSQSLISSLDILLGTHL